MLLLAMHLAAAQGLPPTPEPWASLPAYHTVAWLIDVSEPLQWYRVGYCSYGFQADAAPRLRLEDAERVRCEVNAAEVVRRRGPTRARRAQLEGTWRDVAVGELAPFPEHAVGRYRIGAGGELFYALDPADRTLRRVAAHVGGHGLPCANAELCQPDTVRWLDWSAPAGFDGVSISHATVLAGFDPPVASHPALAAVTADFERAVLAAVDAHDAGAPLPPPPSAPPGLPDTRFAVRIDVFAAPAGVQPSSPGRVWRVDVPLDRLDQPMMVTGGEASLGLPVHLEVDHAAGTLRVVFNGPAGPVPGPARRFELPLQREGDRVAALAEPRFTQAWTDVDLRIEADAPDSPTAVQLSPTAWRSPVPFFGPEPTPIGPRLPADPASDAPIAAPPTAPPPPSAPPTTAQSPPSTPPATAPSPPSTPPTTTAPAPPTTTPPTAATSPPPTTKAPSRPSTPPTPPPSAAPSPPSTPPTPPPATAPSPPSTSPTSTTPPTTTAPPPPATSATPPPALPRPAAPPPGPRQPLALEIPRDLRVDDVGPATASPGSPTRRTYALRTVGPGDDSTVYVDAATPVTLRAELFYGSALPSPDAAPDEVVETPARQPGALALQLTARQMDLKLRGAWVRLTWRQGDRALRAAMWRFPPRSG